MCLIQAQEQINSHSTLVPVMKYSTYSTGTNTVSECTVFILLNTLMYCDEDSGRQVQSIHGDVAFYYAEPTYLFVFNE